MTIRTDREICESATKERWYMGVIPSANFDENWEFVHQFQPQKVMQMLDRQEQLEAKLTEASEFIQKLGPTIDWDIVAEIEEMLGVR